MMPPKIGHIFNTTMKLKWAQQTGKKDHLCPKNIRVSDFHCFIASMSRCLREYMSQNSESVYLRISVICVSESVYFSFRVTESQRLRFLITVVFMSFQAQESKGLSSVSQRLRVIVFQSLNISTQYKVSQSQCSAICDSESGSQFLRLFGQKNWLCPSVHNRTQSCTPTVVWSS